MRRSIGVAEGVEAVARVVAVDAEVEGEVVPGARPRRRRTAHRTRRRSRRRAPGSRRRRPCRGSRHRGRWRRGRAARDRDRGRASPFRRRARWPVRPARTCRPCRRRTTGCRSAPGGSGGVTSCGRPSSRSWRSCTTARRAAPVITANSTQRDDHADERVVGVGGGVDQHDGEDRPGRSRSPARPIHRRGGCSVMSHQPPATAMANPTSTPATWPTLRYENSSSQASSATASDRSHAKARRRPDTGPTGWLLTADLLSRWRPGSSASHRRCRP